MELVPISAAARMLGLTSRTLRYYEQIGLVESRRVPEYAWRMYDAKAMARLSQIVILRKLRIPLKSIRWILQSGDAQAAVEAFAYTLADLDAQIDALTTIRDALRLLSDKLSASVQLEELNEVDLEGFLELLPITRIPLKEEIHLEEIHKADQVLVKLTDRDVRIVRLPPMTVASIRIQSPTAELEAAAPMEAFIDRHELVHRMPAFQHFGLDSPSGEKPDRSDHGYERWLTIPQDLEVEAPFVKREFAGGLYAAYTVMMGGFEGWTYLFDWITQSDAYAYENRDPVINMGCLEEHLNWPDNFRLRGDDPSIQIDLMVPIRRKA